MKLPSSFGMLFGSQAKALSMGEKKINDWVNKARCDPAIIALSTHGTADHLRQVANSITIRARKLSTESSLEFQEVFDFLLRVSLGWLSGGMPLSQVVGKLPRDLRELGIMKMAEDAIEVREKMGKAN